MSFMNKLFFGGCYHHLLAIVTTCKLFHSCIVEPRITTLAYEEGGL
jgi:hypothetical protein